MATRKSKRFEEGGVTEGENTGIGDDVRSRAMKFMRDREENPGMYEAEPEENFKATPKAVSKPAAKPAAARSENYGNEGRRPLREASSPKKANILEEAKAEARSRAAGSKVVRDAQNARSSYGRGPGLSALKMAKGGSVGSASRRADGIASKGKTRGKLC